MSAIDIKMTKLKGYFGSPAIIVTTENIELIQQHSPKTGYELKASEYKFINYDACTVKINESKQIYFPAGTVFYVNKDTQEEIYSFIVVEADIRINYIGYVN